MRRTLSVCALFIILVTGFCSAQSSADSLLPVRVLPTPFTDVVMIDFDLRIEGHYQIGIYDVTGRLMAMPVDEDISGGCCSRTPMMWDASVLLPGVYHVVVYRDGRIVEMIKILKYLAGRP